jgi:hypothetical protein
MHLPIVVGELVRGETLLEGALHHVARTHADESDVHHSCTTFAGQAAQRAAAAKASANGSLTVPDQPDRLYANLFTGERRGSAGMLRDLRDLWLFLSSIEMTWTLAYQAAKAKGDEVLLAEASTAQEELAKQRLWLETKMKVAAPQALLVDPPPQVMMKSLLKKKLGMGLAFTPGSGIYTALAAIVSLGICGLIGRAAKEPMLFPSLGPIILVMLDMPLSPQARPRSSLLANAGALLAGYASLAMFGLLHAPSVIDQGVTTSRIGAAAVSLALTGLVAHLLKATHPPAGATTLIVSLGLLKTPHQLVLMFVAILVVTAVSWLVNAGVGTRAPLWSSNAQPRLVPE